MNLLGTRQVPVYLEQLKYKIPGHELVRNKELSEKILKLNVDLFSGLHNFILVFSEFYKLFFSQENMVCSRWMKRRSEAQQQLSLYSILVYTDY